MQIALLFVLLRFLINYSLAIYLGIIFLSIVIVLAKVNEFEYNQQFWIVVLLIFPGFGFLLYFLWGSERTNAKWKKRVRRIEDDLKKHMWQNPEIVKNFASEHPSKNQIANYLMRQGFPLYQNTKVKYYPLGDDLAEELLQELVKAEKFIFMEYFIVYNGEWWRRIQNVLIQKATQGVDVRLLIDDFGCLFMNVHSLKKELIDHGIKLCSFAPIHKRIYSMSFNYRNHQKITVVDGNVGFTGGINLADEYINVTTRFGHWKDTAVRLEGDAVWSLTTTFLAMWEDASYQKDGNLEYFMPSERKEKHKRMENVRSSESMMSPIEPVFADSLIYSENEKSYVQPYWGGPHRNRNNPVEGVCNRMISRAQNYIYITTPYLVLDMRMQDLLIQAAQSGVDVRIVTPHIYDKWYVYLVNVANYGKLMENGIRIYEYTPGFIHAKNMLSDDECATCGTVNLDFRSLHLHYENSVFFCENQVVADMKQDFENLFLVSEEMDYQTWKHRPIYMKFIQWVFKLFSPLL